MRGRAGLLFFLFSVVFDLMMEKELEKKEEDGK
jgi:hypothetical protein